MQDEAVASAAGEAATVVDTGEAETAIADAEEAEAASRGR